MWNSQNYQILSIIFYLLSIYYLVLSTICSSSDLARYCHSFKLFDYLVSQFLQGVYFTTWAISKSAPIIIKWASASWARDFVRQVWMLQWKARWLLVLIFWSGTWTSGERTRSWSVRNRYICYHKFLFTFAVEMANPINSFQAWKMVLSCPAASRDAASRDAETPRDSVELFLTQ